MNTAKALNQPLLMGERIASARSYLEAKKELLDSCLRNTNVTILPEIDIATIDSDGKYEATNGKLYRLIRVGDYWHTYVVGNKLEQLSTYYYDNNKPLPVQKTSKTYDIKHILTGHTVKCRVGDEGNCWLIHNNKNLGKKDRKAVYINNGQIIYKRFDHLINTHKAIFYHEGKTAEEIIEYKSKTELLKKTFFNYQTLKASYDAKSLPLYDGTELKKEDIIYQSDPYYDAWHNAVIIKNSKVYVVKKDKEDGYYFSKKYLVIIFPVKSFKEIDYYLFDNLFVYKTSTTAGSIELNCNDSKKLLTYHLLLSNESGEVLFLDRPYSQNGRIIDNNIINLKDKSFNIDLDSITIDDSYVSSSLYDIVTTVDGQVFTLKKGAEKIFVIIKNDNVSIFHRTQNSMGHYLRTFPDTLAKFKSFRCQGKKTYFYQDKKTKHIYVPSAISSSIFYKIDADLYNLKTFKPISLRAAVIEDKSGNTYCFNCLGRIIKVRPLDEYEIFEGDSNIAGLTKDGRLEINGNIFEFKNSNLSYAGKVIWENVERIGLRFTIKYPVPNCISEVFFDAHVDDVAYIKFNGQSIYTDNMFDMYANSLGVFLYLKKENTVLEVKGWTSEDIKKSIVSSKNIFELNNYLIVNGYKVDLPEIKMLQIHYSWLLNDIKKNFQNKRFLNRESAIKAVQEEIVNLQLREAQAFGLKITAKDINNYPDKKYLLTVLFGVSHSDVYIGAEDLFKTDLENHIKDPFNYKLTETKGYAELNKDNASAFCMHGISIDKFNNYSESITFTSLGNSGQAKKDALGRSIFTQLYNLLGLRRQGIEGLLQLKKLERIAMFQSDVEMDVETNTLSDEEKEMLIRTLNQLGKKLYKLLKKYGVTLDYTEQAIRFSGNPASKIPLQMLLAFSEELKDRIKDAINCIKKLTGNTESIEAVKTYIAKCLNFILSHIEDDFSEVDLNEDSTKKPQEFTIRLWNRNDLITSLTQGDRTHCCISFRSGSAAIYKYIYKNNINLVEVVAKDVGVIGQAFVYIARTKDPVNYRYSRKRHLFLCIDNVEINGTYSDYAQEIARNLQVFMENYMHYIEPTKISDVLLGTRYNDIEPPYNFKISLELDILGYDEHYLDSIDNFYKFL